MRDIRELYNMLEKMIVDDRFAVYDLIIALTDRLDISNQSSVVCHSVDILETLTGKRDLVSFTHQMQSSIVVCGVYRVDRAVGELCDIGNGISIFYGYEELLYQFLLRNQLLTDKHKLILQKLLLAGC